MNERRADTRRCGVREISSVSSSTNPWKFQSISFSVGVWRVKLEKRLLVRSLPNLFQEALLASE